ncbi:hypothetical protein L1987_33564 [Smallanthus sonchifolius]|uniref:Uncharacterized protein n=1 Tax=Smallanthus sonchifolius TaxID=185202 RepID=A0ACB9HQQ0_9ASTR|nr:hypothetical protein L1987_33564 [Smallanthus sonchifolius]
MVLGRPLTYPNTSMNLDTQNMECYIGCTQPTRLAAMSVAARVSQEMGVKLGHEKKVMRKKSVEKYEKRIQELTSHLSLLLQFKHQDQELLLDAMENWPIDKDRIDKSNFLKARVPPLRGSLQQLISLGHSEGTHIKARTSLKDSNKVRNYISCS